MRIKNKIYKKVWVLAQIKDNKIIGIYQEEINALRELNGCNNCECSVVEYELED